MPENNDVAPVTAPKTETPVSSSLTPILGPLLKALGSQKFVVYLLVAIGCFVLVALGKITWEQAVTFMTVTTPVWLASHALQDGLTKR